MENFISHNPTTVHFGKEVLTNLGQTLSFYGKRVLLVYGQSSIKKSGLYDRVMANLKKSGLTVIEYAGIRSNPIIEDVEAAAEVGRKNSVDMVLAIGGGSVIDSAKVIALTIPVNHPAWDFFIGKATANAALPIITVLTLAATGSEMNPFSVVTNKKAKMKAAVSSPLALPKHSFLDPEVTITVPRDYTAYGVADLMAHCMEAWFGAGDCPLSDKLILGIIKEAIAAGPPLLNDLRSYDLRARIMYAATLALNGITMQGKVSGDWGVHAAGHTLSLLYDIPHGASLTIVYPSWMRLFKNQLASRITCLGSGLFGETLDADQVIDRIEDFFLSLDCPVKLHEMNIENPSVKDIVEAMETSKVNGMNMKFKEGDYLKLVEMFF